MLKTSNKLLAGNLISASKSIIINGIDDNSKVSKAKTKAKRSSGNNKKTTKSNILIKFENHDFF